MSTLHLSLVKNKELCGLKNSTILRTSQQLHLLTLA